jgi:hypothetical protein
MTQDYQVYHQELLTSIALYEESDRPEMEKIEACFKCSLDCWGRLQKHIKKNAFASPGEEIFFFKKVKPQFTAYIEYFTCRYHALLFRPGEDALELARFWRWELRKIEKFYETHKDFCHYIREGLTERDEEYFLREGNLGAQVMTGRIHDLDPGTATPGDYLVTMMAAYELYEIYINVEMKKLGGYFFLTK